MVVEPHYPKSGKGRPPIGLKRMLRIHFLQYRFNLADLACDEALYDNASLLRFRHLLEQHGLGKRLFAEAGRVLEASGITLKTGTIIDATITAALSSTKNADKARDRQLNILLY